MMVQSQQSRFVGANASPMNRASTRTALLKEPASPYEIIDARTIVLIRHRLSLWQAQCRQRFGLRLEDGATPRTAHDFSPKLFLPASRNWRFANGDITTAISQAIVS